LTSSGAQEVGAANHLSDLHGGVIDYNSELVGGNVVAPPNDEVAEVTASDKFLWAEVTIKK